MKPFLAFAALALAAPVLGKSVPPPPIMMTEVVTPDGSASVQMPCAKSDIVAGKRADQGFEMSCKVGPHEFRVASGLPSNEKGREGTVNNYDYLVGMAQNSALKSRMRADMAGSHRRTTIGCRPQDLPICIVLVDRGSLPPLAQAYTINPDAFTDLSDEDKAFGAAMIDGFTRSLEMHD